MNSTSNYNIEMRRMVGGNLFIFNRLHALELGSEDAPGKRPYRCAYGTTEAMLDGDVVSGWAGTFNSISAFFCAGFCAGTLNSIPRSSLALTVAGTSRSAREIFWVRLSKT